MNERQWWAQKVQPKLHRPERNQLFWKQQDAFVKGRPDVLFSIPSPVEGYAGVCGLLELKYDARWPIRPDTTVDVGLTSVQFRHLDAWYSSTRDRRTALVLYGVGDTWYLYHYDAFCLTPDSRHLPLDIRHQNLTSGHISAVGHLASIILNLSK